MNSYRYLSPYSKQHLENPNEHQNPEKDTEQGVGSEHQTDQIIETGSVITGDGNTPFIV